ncbi:hypothetical protein An06g02260 [Aspergillus niger]|uniref:Uncharacterized protein n=2 Tax=Aspergillus niger TaxID=5061 RepID=A2QLS4_ASPNC|nr:hypothetical protein An06g02260 [Aspergillus niger]CAK48069.1 hypothetical protein An06g02260 [Aspergillus niger]
MVLSPEEHTSSLQKRRSILVNTGSSCGSTSQTVSNFFRGNKPKRALVVICNNYYSLRKRMIQKWDNITQQLAGFGGSMKITLYTAHFDAKHDALYLIRNNILARIFADIKVL